MKNQTPNFGHSQKFSEQLFQISKLSYLKRRVFLKRAVKNPSSSFLYRYISLNVNDDSSIEKLRDVIVNSRLWLSSREGFNDPFDTQAKVIIEGNPIQLRKKLNELYKRLEPNLIGVKRKTAIEKLMANQSLILKRVRNATVDALSKVGACCFTPDPRNLLMWSHYANQHKGLLLQFEIAKDTTTFLKTVTVDYVKDYPIINWANETEKEIHKAFLNKHDSWDYEKEVRIIHPHGANTSLSFNAEALTGIIFGCKASREIENKIEELLAERKNKNKPPIKIYNALMHDSKYKIVIKRNTQSSPP